MNDGELTAFSPHWVVELALAAATVWVLFSWLRARRREDELKAEREKVTRRLAQQKEELEAALGSMIESVVAVDMQQNLIGINPAAGRLMNVRPERAVGRSIHEVITSEPLRKVVADALAAEQPIQADLEMKPSPMSGEAEERVFQAQGALLRDSAGRRIGSLIVLHDVTRLRKLEVIRRDFVANASHEIKTPVTAIKAAAETLLDGGDHDAEADLNFLQIILRQANRLQAIIEDLLSLARIEQDAETDRVVLESGAVAAVLNGAAETCGAKAAERQARLEVYCPPELRARMNAPLLEQAAVNLLENAIKYSPEKSVVRVTAERIASEVVITVKDRGVGIAPEHLTRIFERFYRTDKARSRQLGGTGLGLSIVKHIALAHGGRVTVDSAVGVGSTFRIHLPA
jgi:two-component system phosphate regulon sensor histidine kinase PhoR